MRITIIDTAKNNLGKCTCGYEVCHINEVSDNAVTLRCMSCGTVRGVQNKADLKYACPDCNHDHGPTLNVSTGVCSNCARKIDLDFLREVPFSYAEEPRPYTFKKVEATEPVVPVTE